MSSATKQDALSFGGVISGVLTVPRADLHKVRLTGVPLLMEIPNVRPGQEIVSEYAARNGDRVLTRAVVPDLDCEVAAVKFAGRKNAFVNQGLQRVLDSAYNGLTAARITHIGLSADAQAVTAATTSLDPAGGATGTSIKTTANVSRTNQTVHADQTWTQADVAWAITKIGLLTSSAATDVVNIIGGTGGSSPYNEPFTIDLTSIATWSLTMGIDVTATAS